MFIVYHWRNPSSFVMEELVRKDKDQLVNEEEVHQWAWKLEW